MEKKLKVRFAPSPTGPFHIGGARSALFNWLVARHADGTFLVRIEDTDLKRSTKESEENIKDSLKWLGMNWDEGIDVGGPHGPYRQTERLDLYKKEVQRLLDEGKAYYCYCSAEELEKAARRSSMPARLRSMMNTAATLPKRKKHATKRKAESQSSASRSEKTVSSLLMTWSAGMLNSRRPVSVISSS